MGLDLTTPAMWNYHVGIPAKPNQIDIFLFVNGWCFKKTDRQNH
jgi:hypothetical protein